MAETVETLFPKIKEDIVKTCKQHSIEFSWMHNGMEHCGLKLYS